MYTEQNVFNLNESTAGYEFVYSLRRIKKVNTMCLRMSGNPYELRVKSTLFDVQTKMEGKNSINFPLSEFFFVK